MGAFYGNIMDHLRMPIFVIGLGQLYLLIVVQNLHLRQQLISNTTLQTG